MTFTRAALLALVLFVPQMAAAQNTKVSGWLDVTDFGAVPDDSGDDTSAIQAAAAAMSPVATPTTGGVLYFPPGVYRVSGTITIGGTGIVTGAGISRSVIQVTTANLTVFSTTGTTGDIAFRDFKITMTSGVTATGGSGILLTTPNTTDGAQQHARIENVWLDQLFNGIKVTNAAYWVIRDSTITDSVTDDIVINVTSNPDAGDNVITGCTLLKTGASGSGIYLQSSGGQRIISNKINGHANGVLVSPVSSVPLVDVLIANNSFENGTTGVFWQTSVSGYAIVNSHIVGNQFAGQSAAGIVISGNVGGLVINDNQISVSATNALGIYLTGSATGTPSQLTLVGNNITGNASSGSVGISAGSIATAEIHGNYVAGTATAYAALGGHVSDAAFTAATLPAAGNGSTVYCQDCVIASSCSGSGSGAFAKRINGAWICN